MLVAGTRQFLWGGKQVTSRWTFWLSCYIFFTHLYFGLCIEQQKLMRDALSQGFWPLLQHLPHWTKVKGLVDYQHECDVDCRDWAILCLSSGTRAWTPHFKLSLCHISLPWGVNKLVGYNFPLQVYSKTFMGACSVDANPVAAPPSLH